MLYHAEKCDLTCIVNRLERVLLSTFILMLVISVVDNDASANSYT